MLPMHPFMEIRQKQRKKLGEVLEAKGGKKVVVSDLSREDMAEAIEDAFRYDKIVVACATYDGGLFPVMQDFLYHLGHKTSRTKSCLHGKTEAGLR